MKKRLPDARATVTKNATVSEPMPRLLRTHQAARYLNVSAWKIRQLVADGALPIVQADPHAPFLVDRADLDKWVEGAKHRRCDFP